MSLPYRQIHRTRNLDREIGCKWLLFIILFHSVSSLDLFLFPAIATTLLKLGSYIGSGSMIGRLGRSCFCVIFIMNVFFDRCRYSTFRWFEIMIGTCGTSVGPVWANMFRFIVGIVIICCAILKGAQLRSFFYDVGFPFPSGSGHATRVRYSFHLWSHFFISLFFRSNRIYRSSRSREEKLRSLTVCSRR